MYCKTIRAASVIAFLITGSVMFDPSHGRGMGYGGKHGHGGAHGGCFSPNFVTLGSETTVRWVVRQPKGCAVNATPGNIATYGIAIVTRPKHGTAGVFSRYSVAYKPNPGFEGDDEFSYAVIGRGGANPDKMVIRVQVSVADDDEE